MLSRSLTSCLIKPLTNDRVWEINSICCLKGPAHSEWHALLGAAPGLSCYMVIEDYGSFAPHTWMKSGSMGCAHTPLTQACEGR